MQIYLLYQTDWLAAGSGYDDKIGALWVNKLQPSEIASATLEAGEVKAEGFTGITIKMKFA